MNITKYFMAIIAILSLTCCHNDTDTPVDTEPHAVVSPEGCIENDMVYAYMSCGGYEAFGDESWLKSPVVVLTAKPYDWQGDRPKGITVSWEERSDVTVTLSAGASNIFQDSASDTTSYTFTNLIPGTAYTYTVRNAAGKVKEGSFTPSGQVRMVDIPGSWNWRDLGGWKGFEGRSIRYGWLYRGGSLNGLFNGTTQTADVYDYTKYDVPEGMHKAFETIGIKAELDLRGDPDDPGENGDEYEPHTGTLRHCQIEGIDYIHIMSDYGLYHGRLRSPLVQDVAWIISELKQGKPVAFHCKSGADRTGALSLVIEGLLGVSEGDAARDYELTSFSTELSKRFVRYASSAKNFFNRKTGFFAVDGETFHEKCYRYLNSYFEDVHINADDLDWFISFMLDWKGFVRPSYARNYENNSLEQIVALDTGSASHLYQ